MSSCIKCELYIFCLNLPFLAFSLHVLSTELVKAKVHLPGSASGLLKGHFPMPVFNPAGIQGFTLGTVEKSV